MEDNYNDETIIETEVEETVVQEEELQQHKESKKGGFLKTLLLLILTGVIGLGSGYAGAKIALNSNKLPTKQEVLYQSVIQTDSNGNEINTLSKKDVIANVKDSVVEITTSGVEVNWFFQEYVTSGAGSGVIISEDGVIITNHHVIEKATEIVVRLSNGDEYPATLIGSDAQTDVAVLRIEASGLKPAIMGDSSMLAVGADVLAIGNPLGSLGGSVTEGIISALDRQITIDGQSMTLLQTSAAINPGNSGGGLFNMKGELIGVVNAKSSGEDIEGLGFAIPINVAKQIAEDLIEQGKVTGRLSLGIRYYEISNAQLARQYNVNTLGLYIGEVVAGSNAERAGLQPGDVITGVDGEQVTTSDELKAALKSHKPGETMVLDVVRNKEYIVLEVVLLEDD